jgi:hypothetical protein
VARLLKGKGDVIECLDNEAATFIHRSGKAGKSTSDVVAEERRALCKDFPQLRIFTLHNKREQGRIPDALSNGCLRFKPPIAIHDRIYWGHDSWTGITWALQTMHTYGVRNFHWITDSAAVTRVTLHTVSEHAQHVQRTWDISPQITSSTIDGQFVIDLASLSNFADPEVFSTLQGGPPEWAIVGETSDTVHGAYLRILPSGYAHILQQTGWESEGRPASDAVAIQLEHLFSSFGI